MLLENPQNFGKTGAVPGFALWNFVECGVTTVRWRQLEEGIQHVIEQGEAAFGGFQALLDGGVDEALRDEACERRGAGHPG